MIFSEKIIDKFTAKITLKCKDGNHTVNFRYFPEDNIIKSHYFPYTGKIRVQHNMCGHSSAWYKTSDLDRMIENMCLSIMHFYAKKLNKDMTEEFCSLLSAILYSLIGGNEDEINIYNGPRFDISGDTIIVSEL